MFALLTVLVVITLSLVVTRVASVALTHTGLSLEMARFQARSAFTGVGFTTQESESIVNHPVRRRIVMLLMLLGNAGFITGLASLVLAFVDGSAEQSVIRMALLLTGLVVVWRLSSSRWFDQRLSVWIDRALERWADLDARDYASLLHVGGPYRVAYLYVEEDDWLAGKTLREARLWDEGVLVLGIERQDGEYIGAPSSQRIIRARDQLLLYGRDKSLAELDERRRGYVGDVEHVLAVREQQEVKREEAVRDEEATEEALAEGDGEGSGRQASPAEPPPGHPQQT